LWIPALAIAAVSLFYIAGAGAWDSSVNGVQNTGLFQLDGNTLPTPCVANDPTQNDWAGLFNAGGTAPCGSDGFSFVADGVGNADSTYWQGGGSKDANDPAAGPWLWGPNNVSPDKNDLDNAFAALYHLTDQAATNNLGTVPFLFFGSDRFDTSGDAQQGFQFLQANTCLAGPVSGVSAGGTAACPASTPNQAANAGKFVDPTTGNPVHHINGDILVLVNFNKGGTLGSAGVFLWSGATQANPGGGSYSQVQFGSGTNAADCSTITGQSNFCATSNTSPLGSEPVWAYTAKNVTGQATYASGAFIEGGVNLKAIPGSGSCFPSFVAESRSAAGPGTGLGLTAQLKDLAFGKFEACQSGTVTTPEDSSGNSIQNSSISIGSGKVQVKDLATVSGSGIGATTAPTGTVKFWLCGPAASDAAAQCDGTAAGPTNGVAVTPNATLGNPSGATATATSALATVTSAGHYCWRADYGGDSNYPPSSDRSLTECFTVTPVTPAIVTHQSASGGVPLGTAITDTADVSGTATQPANPVINLTNTAGSAASGTVTFKLYGPRADPATPVCNSTTLVFTSSAFSATGNQSGVGPASYTPTAAGTYDWVATYDSSNVNSPGPVSSACGDEPSVLISLQPTMTTAQKYVLHDEATVNLSASGAGDMKGSVRFRLYNNSTCDTTAPNALLYDSNTLHPSGIAVDATGQSFPQSVTVSSDNVNVNATASTLSWLVQFTSTVNGIKNVTSACNSEHSSVTIDNDGTASTP
jgi:hypothetical protein